MTIVGYKHQDDQSKAIRAMNNEVAHNFLCHNDKTDECDGGMNCAANPQRLKIYEKAFENGDKPRYSQPMLDKFAACGCRLCAAAAQY